MLPMTGTGRLPVCRPSNVTPLLSLIPLTVPDNYFLWHVTNLVRGKTCLCFSGASLMESVYQKPLGLFLQIYIFQKGDCTMPIYIFITILISHVRRYDYLWVRVRSRVGEFALSWGCFGGVMRGCGIDVDCGCCQGQNLDQRTCSY
jgi:hypothetical protein